MDTIKEFNIDSLKDYINNNFSNPDLNVNFISHKFGISLSYMSRNFKKIVGIGMADYISKCRINKAKDYLENTDYSISTIVNLIGLCSANVFVRSFKKEVGLTPKHYRISRQI